MRPFTWLKRILCRLFRAIPKEEHAKIISAITQTHERQLQGISATIAHYQYLLGNKKWTERTNVNGLTMEREIDPLAGNPCGQWKIVEDKPGFRIGPAT